MVRSTAGFFLMMAAAGVLASQARAGSVVLTNGTTETGTVMLVGTGGTGGEVRISVLPVGKPQKTYALSEVKSAVFDSRVGAAESREADGVPWSKTEVGDAKTAGQVVLEGTRVTMTDSSSGFRIGGETGGRVRIRQANDAPINDSCCFVFQKLEDDGDAEIQAKVLPSESTKWVRAGLMICEGLGGDGPMVFLSRTADPVQATMTVRERPGMLPTTSADAINLPVEAPYLKLTRTAGVIRGYESVDGVRWTEIAPQQLRPLRPARPQRGREKEKEMVMDSAKGVYIGVAATGNYREGTAVFEGIKLKGNRGVPALPGLGDTQLADTSLTLQDGTVLAGTLESIGADNQGKFKRAGDGEMAIPETAMARAQFGALTREERQKFTSSTTGVLTRDGDFLDGDISELKADSVTVSSIAFGLTTMERGRIFGVVFPAPAGGAAPGGGVVSLRLNDGSLLMGKKLTLEKDQLVLDEPLLGPMRVPVKDVLSLDRRGE